ncbi:amino acid adenylation domain-containing protein [Anaeromicropila populeti]|nr:amino acid adenylation domain-containing protein [Anaeromicropila populeti]
MNNIMCTIENNVKMYSDKIAIQCGDECLTYEEVQRKYNHIAMQLIQNSKAAANVVIFVEKGADLVISILGTLKAGFVFIPIDINMPKKRIEMIIKKSEPTWIVTKCGLLENLKAVIAELKNVKVLIIEDELKLIENVHNEKLSSFSMDIDKMNIPVNKYAYIYFTSGSTGEPKGVLGRSRSLKHFIDWEINEFKLNENVVVSQLTSPSFDPFLRDIFVPLCAGGKLCIPPTQDIILEPKKLIDWIEVSKVSAIHMVPSLFSIMTQNIESIKKLSTLNYIFLAGEILRGSCVKEFIEKFGDSIQLVNLYGPTETTLAKMFYRVQSSDVNRSIIPVGKPLSQTEILILDDNMVKCPVGNIGNIYIRTPYISSGYYKEKEQTRQVFIQNPFSSNSQDIIYKTGDIGRCLIDGNVEVLGRKDNQVKISGVRIELSEIENALLNYEKINDVVVVAKENDRHEKYLIGYYIADQVIDTSELKVFLKSYIQEFMIPKYFMQVDKFPVLPSGKINRRELPEVNEKEFNAKNFVAPRNEIEKGFAKIWELVLDVERVGIEDNFFMLGGNSLKAIKAFSILSEEYEFSINDIFKYGKISEIVKRSKKKKVGIAEKFQQLYKISTNSLLEQTISNGMSEKLEKYRKKAEKYKAYKKLEKNNYNKIILMGATGFLGINVLNALLTMTDACIYVIIRGKSLEEANERLKQKFSFYFEECVYRQNINRIVVFNGDLTEQYFGLNENEYNKLADNIECIINCAANVSHYGDYSKFYKINVGGVEKLIKFAMTGKNKVLNHISTTGVARGKVEDKDFVVYTEDDCDLGQVIESPYNLTKLEAEKIIHDARKQGLKANIMRVGNLVFNTETGKFQENIEESGLYALIKAFVKIKAFPNIENGAFEFSYVNYVSQAIVNLVNIKNLENETYNIFNNRYDGLVKLGKYLMKRGYDVEVAEMKYFLENLEKSYANPDLKPYVNEILLHTRMLEGKKQTVFYMLGEKTNYVLKNLNMQWAEFDEDLAYKMVRNCEMLGFINK